MRVYKFTSEKHAKSTLEKRRIKISEIHELNDPYELLGLALPNKEIRNIFLSTRKQFSEEYGVICFSKNWINPVLWSHYGDKHYGIVLGFDIPDEYLDEVKYVNSLLAVDETSWFENSDMARKQVDELLLRKYIDWKYEEEYRCWVKLEERDEDANIYHIGFSNKFILREVILGARCDTDRQKLKKIITGCGSHVEIIKARLAFNSYSVVKNKKYRTMVVNA